jgi:hypothetical protein
MKRTILAALAALLLPSLATAEPNRMVPRSTNVTKLQNQYFDSRRVHDMATLGNGQSARSAGDVAGPGNHSRVDNSVKGPMNDRDPGNHHSEDVPQSAAPPPAR